jgi:siroheme synthase-like protein
MPWRRRRGLRGILLNSVDDPPDCDFFYPSVVRRGDLQIAISTAGKSPALAQRLREEIDALLPEDTGAWLDRLGETRLKMLAAFPLAKTASTRCICWRGARAASPPIARCSRRSIGC